MVKHFDLRQLEAFSAVISTGSITGAARLIGKSQPVVTRLIQDLEDDLGFELFARHGRGVAPTQNAALFHKEAERLLASAGRARKNAQDISVRQSRSMDMVATASLAAAVVPAALAILQRGGLLPREVSLRSLLPEEVIQTVASRDADIGIASLPLDHPGLEVHWVGEASCVCVVQEGDPLAARDVIPVEALARRALITMSNPYRVLGRVSAALRRGHVDADSVIVTNSSVTALRLVQTGLGVAVVEPLTPRALQLPGIVARPLDVHIPYLWGIISPVGLPASPTIAPLVDALGQAARTELPGFRQRDVRDMEAILKAMYDGASTD